ncbi:MAG TPA: glucosaminidase domain-containing protein [Symbiobacteriaceae bacterium]|nr:glucosaminidase domain-containing protein [Symbiobacteriaceae bacterium]
MSAILVRPELLQQLAGEISRLAAGLQEIDGRLAAHLQGLDWDVRRRTRVEDLAAKGRREGASLSDHAQQLGRFLQLKAEAILEADRQGAAGFRALAGLEAAAGPGSPAINPDDSSGSSAGGAPPAVDWSPLDSRQYGFSIDNQAFLAASKRERLEMLMPAFTALEARYHVPWQIQAAQWAVESGWGENRPADVTTGQESYNIFGMKGEGPAGTTFSNTTEQTGDRFESVTDGFRAYNGFGESVVDHARLLATDHYKAARDCGSDLRGWCEQLGPKACGYATGANYPDLLWGFMKSEEWVK